MELFTERLKLKDIVSEMEGSEQKELKKICKNIKELIQSLVKEYSLKEEDIEFIRKKTPLKAEDIKIEDGERAAIRYINTADVDRDNEIVVPDGAQVKDFLKSPSVLYAHDYRGFPIGRDDWLKLIEGKGWLAKTLYAKHQKAVDIYNMVKEHFLNTNSIGFIPLESVKPDSKGWDKVKAKLMDVYGIKEKLIDKCRRIYTKWILLEHSDVPIPSNINALNIAVGKGFVIKDTSLIEDLGIEIVDDKEEEGEAIELEAVEKPYPNEHACRLRNPGDFQPGSFRRMSRTSDGKEYSVIMGRLKGETTMTEQAYRYGIKVWTVTQARKHCKDHKGIAFEPATGKEEESKEDKLKEIGLFDVNEIYETIRESKELKLKVDELNKSIKDIELKAGTVLNTKNKQDLKKAQRLTLNQEIGTLIQGVLDSAEISEDSLEIGDEEDNKNDNTIIDIVTDTVDDVVIDKEEDEGMIEVDEEIIAKAVNDQIGYIMGKVKKQSDTKKIK